MGRSYKSEALASAHELVEALHRAGGADRKTMRDFDELCLTSIAEMPPEQIRALRPPGTRPPRLNIRLETTERSSRVVLRAKAATIGTGERGMMRARPSAASGSLQVQRTMSQPAAARA